MLQDILQQIKNELVNGCVKKGHPFRYFTLTTSLNNVPKARTVVLRKIKPGIEIWFYTDKRSNKVNEIMENNNVTALFYNPKKLLQITISGKASFEENDEVLNELWNSIPLNSRNDYTSSLAPGSLLKNPDLLNYQNQNHFCLIKIKATKIDFLQLKRPNHIRAQFDLNVDNWEGTFLVP
ncbi:pyridoxamine 5'-phosphate oxidase family protein [Croceivirga thetidis]|uniref:Pyridoxamine 5'-phosphate oxidase family protein n=1 Tax=Croceivirga thetidis TaxID=2721623 RepID=A0ABX1GV60_9FLAO|nr:pyridoxamine 5'-phosphate oxidase family protein [Croceivirga thetidis]NKI33528.1 pyridoxamine 5'-phosphate oxidase family protein [Croceivirga thetidis]